MTTKSKPKKRRPIKKVAKRISTKAKNKMVNAHLLGSASFVFTTEEINAIKSAVKNSLLVDAEYLEETNSIKTPALSKHLENEVSTLESVLTKLNFND